MSSKKAHVDATQTLEESTVQNHLVRRGARYCYRRRIPLDLVEHYGGRKELTKALGTADPKEAAKRARLFAVQHDEEFAAIRLRLQSEPTSSSQAFSDSEQVFTPSTSKDLVSPSPGTSGGQILRLRSPLTGDPVAEAHRILATLRLKRTVAESKGRDELNGFIALERFGLMFSESVLAGTEESDEPMWKHEASVMARRQFFEDGGYGTLQVSKKIAPEDRISAQTAAETSDSRTSIVLTELIDLWKQDRNPTNPKTISTTELVVRRFNEYHGVMPIQSITRTHCFDFRNWLRDSGQTIPNTNNYIDKLRALFGVAHRAGLVTANPATDLAINDPIPAIDKRKPFDIPALISIFSSPVYTKSVRPEAGAGEAAYWLPLLALFTGARLEELGQLYREDIRQEVYEGDAGEEMSGWIIHLTTEGNDKKLKNLQSRRHVPVHDELKRLGFIEYVQTIKAGSRIFPELKKDVTGRITGNWSKWFSRWLRGTCAVSDKRMVFHSFRHFFKHQCRAVGIEEAIHDAYTGHAGVNSVGRRYGDFLYPLPQLVSNMKKFRLPREVQAVVSSITG